MGSWPETFIVQFRQFGIADGHRDHCRQWNTGQPGQPADDQQATAEDLRRPYKRPKKCRMGDA